MRATTGQKSSPLLEAKTAVSLPTRSSAATLDAMKKEAAEIFGTSPRTHHAAPGPDFVMLLLGPVEGALMLFLNALGFPPLFIGAIMSITALLFVYRKDLSLELAVRLLAKLVCCWR